MYLPYVCLKNEKLKNYIYIGFGKVILIGWNIVWVGNMMVK